MRDRVIIKEEEFNRPLNAELEFVAWWGEDRDWVFFRGRENGILRMNMFIERDAVRDLRDFLNEYLQRG